MTTIISVIGIFTVTRGQQVDQFVEVEAEYHFSGDGKRMFLRCWGKKFTRSYNMLLRELEINETTPANAAEATTLIDAALSEAADLGGGGSSYLVYTALLTQTNLNAPIEVTVFENTLGNALIYTYDYEGGYNATIPGGFDRDKTFVNLQNTAGAANTMAAFIGVDGRLYIETTNGTGTFTYANNVLTKSSIEIRVYP